MKRLLLVGLLVVSFALRVWLAAKGGQDFWPDESRYASAQIAVADFGHGNWSAAAGELFGHADHIFFRPACLPVAMVEYWMGGRHRVLVSCYFSLFSVGAIFLVWAIARRTGASEEEALWAAFLAATANCLFFYSRHFLPYDIALFVLLGALWLAMGPPSAGRSFGVGCAVGLGILVYNGYWLLGATVLALHLFRGGAGIRGLVGRIAGAGSGLAVTVAAGLGLGVFLSRDLLSSIWNFASSVKQGDFHVGYKVIPEYLWASEHGILLVWLAALAYAAAVGFRRKDRGRIRLWLWGAAFIFVGLVFFSDVVTRFMVYGRLTRQIAPFACLGAACGIAEFTGARRRLQRPLTIGLVAIVGGLAAWNFAVPLRLVFPEDFLRMANKEISRQAGSDYAFYQILDAETLWGTAIGRDLPPHEVVLRRPNPMLFRPYQFEGYSAEQRRLLERYDVSMRLIRFQSQLSRSGSRWDGYPGPVSMTVKFSPEFWNESEPIAVSGRTGFGDTILVRYPDGGHLQFGLDHWGSPEILSEPIKVDLSRTHSLVISAGNLVPPKGDPFYRTHPELEGLWDRLVVVLDGQIVMSKRAEFHASNPQNISFGASTIGGTATRPNFTGTVSEFKTAPFGDLVHAIPALAAREIQRSRSADWRGAMGPLRLRFRMPAVASGPASGQPLLSLGGPGSNAVLYAVRDGDKSLRIGLDRRNEPLLLSGPLPLSASGVEVLDICSGSLLPPADAPIFSKVPGLGGMRDSLYVHLDGAQALQVNGHFPPVAAEWISPWANAVGSSVCGDSFQGDIMSVEAIGPRNLLPLGNRLSDLLVNLEEGWGGFTGPLRLRLSFPQGRAGRCEPLLVTGSKGASDVLCVRYEEDGRVRFGFRHSGGPESESLPIDIGQGGTHELLLSVGSLMPPEESGVYREEPEYDQFRSIVDLVVDGRPALFLICAPHPSARESAEVGRNPLGAGATEMEFTGTFDALTRASPNELLEAASAGAALGRAGWSGYPGPLQMKVVFAAAAEGQGQPIVTTGYPGAGDFILVQYGPNGTARIVEDHWGDPLLRSEPFPLVPGAEHRLAVSFGALLPPAGDALYRREPSLAALRDTITVELDGRRILTARRPSHPTAPERIIIGANYIGGSYAGSIFAGRISGVEAAPVEPVAP